MVVGLGAQRIGPAVILPTAVLACMAAICVLLVRHRRRRCPDEPKHSPTELLSSATCQPCEGESAFSAESVLQPSSPPTAQSPSAEDRTPRKALLGGRYNIGLSKDSSATTRRDPDNIIGWHDYFMSVAMLSAYRSKDPSRQVGACIVDPKTQRIVGIGYNGFPWGCPDDQLPWARSAASGSWLDTKYPYVCHAEMNAIFNKNCSSLEGCRIYTTLFPCNECAKLIIQSRMLDVVYLSDSHSESDAMKASRRMLQLSGLQTWAHKPAASRIVLDFESELAQ